MRRTDDRLYRTGRRVPGWDGFSMPGEFEPHEGCILIWPFRPGSWNDGAAPAREAFRQVIYAIAESEKVWVAAGKACFASARRMLLEEETGQPPEVLAHIQIFQAETDDSWARDIAPTFLKNASGQVSCVNWEFNAWGGKADGLYASWERDNAFAKAFAAREGYFCYDAAPFVLEGGAIHSDGAGTLLVTESCLLSAGRNPGLSKKQIEKKLKCYLGMEKVIWLPRGIYGDETNEHVDNVCAFVKPGHVVLAWTDKKEDPQYELSLSCLNVLERERDARGRTLTVHRLPVPDVPVCVTAQEAKGFVFEEGEAARKPGERLAASYVNFYFSNGAVVMPAFGGENERSDQRAAKILERLCPDRKVIPIAARALLLGGGNIHCITQQVPKGKKEKGRSGSFEKGNRGSNPDELQKLPGGKSAKGGGQDPAGNG